MMAWLGALVLGALLALAAACGDGEDAGADQTPADGGASPLGQLQAQPQPVQALDPRLTEPQNGLIEVTERDIAFAPNKLKIPLGQAVTIRVVNGDPVEHNLRLAGVDGRYDTEDDAVTEPPTIAAGARGELIFSPQIPGAYTFRCDFHPSRMGGQIVVE